MKYKMNPKIITPNCTFDCEMIVAPDASLENQEIRKIYDESISMYDEDHHFTWVSISDFTNSKGQTIGEFLLENHEAFAIALAREE